ncbi:MAG: reactive intermediate/imine deaminase [Anaerolineaceae bacterium]|nr:reactive intermediate/imine deaminase [Anaerolineaceae bacterium]
MSKINVTAPLAPPAVGPYSHAVVVNGLVYTAGQIGLIPGTKEFADGGIQGQTAQVLENLKGVLEASGSQLEKVVKTTVFLANMDDFAAMNEIYARYFWRNRPARSAVEVSRLPLGALVEIEAIAQV